MKIVFLETKCLGGGIQYNVFSELGEIYKYQYTSMDELSERIADADIIILNKIPMNEATLSQAKKLKLICVTATGTNNVDFEYTNKRNITVTNVKGYSTETVAQHTFALYFSLAEQIARYDECVKSKEYSKSGMFVYYGHQFHDLCGQTWGIVGLGAIGERVAQIARAFGCKVQYYSTSGRNNNSEYKQVSFDELLESSDIVSIHAPLNDATENLFDKEAFTKMKENAILLNLGRGPIVNEQALADALNEEKIAGAGLDVFTMEPLPEASPLFEVRDQDKLILTPHIAWSSLEARNRLMQEVFKNIKAFLNNEERNVVR